jgi:hypothetical protein
MRLIATGIEAYTTDYNRPPRMRYYEFYSDPSIDMKDGEILNGNLSPVLSTPVAYLSNSDILDPFMTSSVNLPLTERLYTYQDIREHIKYYSTSQFWPLALDFYGPWRVCSVGPDQMFSHGFNNSGQLPYDPTNGIVSLGNLWYSPKYHFEGPMPRIPDLLGEH